MNRRISIVLLLIVALVLSTGFTKIKKARKIKSKEGRTTYITRMTSEDAFSLIYDNPNNKELEKNTNVYLVTNSNEVEEIYFSIKDKSNNNYSVNLKLDFGLQNIELDVN